MCVCVCVSSWLTVQSIQLVSVTGAGDKTFTILRNVVDMSWMGQFERGGGYLE